MPTNKIQRKQLYEPGVSGFMEEVYSATLSGKASNILPLNNSTYDLGSTSLKWKDVHTTGVHADAMIAGQLYAGVVVSSPTPPTSQASAGQSGQLAIDSTYFYVCTGQNSWGRVSWAAW